MLWVMAALSVGSVSAADYYMATTSAGGNYGNAGTLVSPFRTILQFNTVAKPGDTLFIRGGVYITSETIFTASGLPGQPITIRNYPGEVPILDGNRSDPGSGTNGIVLEDGVYSGVDGPKHDLVFDGLVMRNWKRGALYFGDVKSTRTPEYISCYNIVVRNCLVDYCGQLGIRFTHSDHVLIENSIFGRTGWDRNYGSWSSNINFIENNGKNLKVSGCVGYHGVDVSDYHTDGNGMIMDVHGWTAGQFDPAGVVENSLFFANGGAGIAWTNSNNATIVNNTLYDNGKDPTYVHGKSGLVFWNAPDKIVVRNNIIYQPNGVGIKVGDKKPFTNSVFENNNVSGQDGAQDPKFMQANSGNLQLATNSPSRDAGLTNNVPASSIGLDPRVFKIQTTDQPIDWYNLAPDLDFIISQGGLAGCYHPVSRPQGGGVDLGAYEAGNASTPPPVTPPVVPPPGNSNKIQAEAGTWSGSGVGVVTSISGYEGSGAIGPFSADGDQLVVTFPQQPAGNYTLKVRYHVWTAQQNAWVLNGTSSTVTWAANDGGWAVKEIPLTLAAGVPVIGIAKIYGYMSIDYFELVAAGTVPSPPANVAPAVEAGGNQTVPLTSSVSLNGVVSDDGLPANTLTTLWTKISGPGAVTFANGSALATSATFSQVGTYVLRLTATDGQLSTTDNLTIVVSAAAAPNGMTTGDIGVTGLLGSSTWNGSLLTIQGSGADIWGRADAYRFVRESLAGNGDVVVRLDSHVANHPWAKAGIMMRDGTASGARHVSLFMTKERGIAFQYRVTTGGPSYHMAGPALVPPVWLQIIRRGNTYTASVSTNGSAWSTIGQRQVTLNTNAECGLAVTSHQSGVLSTASFSQLLITPVTSN